MAEIIIIRHGETALNVSSTFRGRLDVPLNDNGIRQAELLSGYMSQWKIDVVYSSPLKRAFQTAEIVATPHNLNVEAVQGFNDLSFGKWERLTREEVAVKFNDSYLDWLERPERVQMPGGENLADVRRRALASLNEILAKTTGVLVLVSHRVVNKVLICALLGLDDSHFWNIEQDTCGITIFKYDDKMRFILTRHNDTSFLNKKRGATLDF